MPTIYIFATSWFISGAALLTALSIFKKWKKDKVAISFGLFWLMATGVWFFAGGEVFFWWKNMPFWARASSYLSEIFIISEGPFLVYYLIMKSLTKERLAKIFFLIYILGAFIYIYFTFTEKLPGPFMSNWGWKLAPAPSAFKTIQILYLGPSFFVLFDFFKRIKNWIQEKKLKNPYLFSSTVSLIIYMGVAYFDAQGKLIGWPLMLIRTIIFVSVLISYLSYSLKSEEKKQLTYEI